MPLAATNFNELGLFTGVPQIENFSRLHELLPVRSMASSTAQRPLDRGPEQLDLPKTFVFQQQEHDVEQVLDETDTSALLVVHNGNLVHESYFKTGGPAVPWLSMSVAKSVVSALIGIAADKGLIASIEDSISDYIDVEPGSAYDGVVIRDVLQMSSGARWNEDYSDPDSDAAGLAAAMQFSPGLTGFVATMEKELQPGTVCRYNSGDTQALGLLLNHVTDGSLAEFAQSQLFEPLGIEDAGYWLLDADGMEAVFAGLLLSARDYAKIGELYRKMGRIGGQQVVPASWVEASTRSGAAHTDYGNVILSNSVTPFGYGYQWWLPVPHHPEQFTALGVYNQFIYVDRDRDAVVVKLSANPRYGLSPDEADNRDMENIALLREIIQSL